MVVFDTSVVAIAFDENAAVPRDPETGNPLTKSQERINALLNDLATRHERVLIPTPVVAEYLVHGGPDKGKRAEIITSNKAFVVAPFDFQAAVECALIEDDDRDKHLSLDATKAKVKFDRQIIAIARVCNAHTIYTGDKQLGARATACGLTVAYTWNLALPNGAQMDFDYAKPDDAQVVGS